MPDTRRHRGPHPDDARHFAPEAWPALQAAVADFSYLLTRGYAWPSALKLVGDRFQLVERQRRAVLRSSCSDQALQRRRRTQVSPGALAGKELRLDGFNVLTTIEAALAGGVLLLGRDGCCRDLASMHGSYRKVAETRPALGLLGEVLAELEAGRCRWYFDRPVSNSGRLARILRELAAASGWDWEVELVADPDAVLRGPGAPVASADSAVLDGCEQWFNLAAETVRRCLPDARPVPMATYAIRSGTTNGSR